jgi:hypothetical protein
MTRDGLTALIARVEAATVAEQSDVLAAALMAARKAGWFTAKQYSSALRMLAAGAYESAAASLVPEGCEWTRHFGANGRLTMMVHGPDPAGSLVQAATPALALTAAALRARLAQMGDDA